MSAPWWAVTLVALEGAVVSWAAVVLLHRKCLAYQPPYPGKTVVDLLKHGATLLFPLGFALLVFVILARGMSTFSATAVEGEVVGVYKFDPFAVLVEYSHEGRTYRSNVIVWDGHLGQRIPILLSEKNPGQARIPEKGETPRKGGSPVKPRFSGRSPPARLDITTW